MDPIHDLDTSESDFSQIGTAPTTHIKRKRGEIISRSLPDRFPHQQRRAFQPDSSFVLCSTSSSNQQQRTQQPSHRSCSSSPFTYPFLSNQTSSSNSLLTVALRRHRPSRSSHLTDLIENINEIDSGSGRISP